MLSSLRCNLKILIEQYEREYLNYIETNINDNPKAFWVYIRQKKTDTDENFYSI